MQPQIVHETEVHRQHVRLKIPIQIELDGVRYLVDDWSVGGFAVESAMTSRDAGERFTVRMIFPFEQFDMSMRLDARTVYVDQDHGRFGCAFLGLSREQIAVFRYLVDAYLSGEVVSAGDILQIRSREAEARFRARPDLGFLGQPEVGLGRRIWTFGALGLAGMAHLTLIGLGLHDRVFAMTATGAVVDAPVREIRAPVGGHFLALVEPGAEVRTGDMLGTLEAGGGRVEPLTSPCDCVVLDQIGRPGESVQSGDALLALIGAGEPLVVRAQLALEEVERLEAGGRAEIRLLGRREPRFGEIVRIDLRPRLEALGRSAFAAPVSHRLAQVVVRPDRPFELEEFGALVRLRFL